MVTDVCDELAKPFFIPRKLTVLDIFSKNIAKDPSEIFMTGKGEETSGIGQHTDKATHQTHVGEGIDLLFHPVFLIEIPPARAELDFSFDRSVIEVADHGCKYFIVSRVEVVNHRFCQLIGGIQVI